jgi:hypothetical protein
MVGRKVRFFKAPLVERNSFMINLGRLLEALHDEKALKGRISLL